MANRGDFRLPSGPDENPGRPGAAIAPARRPAPVNDNQASIRTILLRWLRPAPLIAVLALAGWYFWPR